MKEETVKEEPVKEGTNSFKTWYDKNKESFNAERRQRYATDLSYRERERFSVRTARALKPKADPQMVGMVSRSVAARTLNREPRALYEWEQKEWVPVAEKNSRGHTFYTPHQVKLMQMLVEVLDKTGRTQIEQVLQPVVAAISEAWNAN